MITPFQNQVYNLTKQIPTGQVTTYKELAYALGTAAYRAVGTALKCNPDIPKTPCHRVVNSDGRIGGYLYGSERKKELLKAEGVEIVNDKIDLAKFGHTFT